MVDLQGLVAAPMLLPAGPALIAFLLRCLLFSTGLNTTSLFSTLCYRAGEKFTAECAQLRKTYGS